MNRITRDEMLMEIALTASRRSTCNRKQVGAVLSREGRVLSIGYAGAPSGFPHCTEAKCDLSQPCRRTVHAEANALAFAAKYGISTLGASIYCTLAPCLDCAKLAINCGIIEIVFSELYRTSDGLELLRAAGIRVRKFLPGPPTEEVLVESPEDSQLLGLGGGN